MHEPVLTSEQTATAEHEQMLRAVAVMKAEIAQTTERVERVLERLRARVAGHTAQVLRLVGVKP